jgi:hypothetical protein
MGTNNLNYENVAKTTAKVEQSGDQLAITLEPLSFVLLRSSDSFMHSRITGIQMTPKYEENDRVFLPIEVEFDNPEQFNMAHLDFYAVDAAGEERLIAFDTTAPYRAVLMPDQLEGVDKIKVVANNYSKQSVSKTFSF